MAGLINDWQAIIDGQKNNALPDWLVAQKKEALTQLNGFESPNRKMETWRYADAGRLLGDTSTVEPKDLDLAELEADCCVVVTSEGVEVVGEQPTWLKVTPLKDATEGQWQVVKAHSLAKEQGALLLNQALVTAGCVVEVAANSEGKHVVIAMVHDFSGDEWQFVSNHYIVGANSHVQFKEVVSGGRLNLVNAWLLGRDAGVHRTAYSELQDPDVCLVFNHFDLAQNAEMHAMNHRSGGALQHHNQQVVFDAEHAKYRSGSINKTNNNSNITDIVNVFHNNKNNECEVIHRSIADDVSQIFTNAKAFVAHGADHSVIAQDLKNILLSEDAKIFSKPELEVNTDEVIAAHGSTIGALDEQALFYLQSRGVSLAQARDIMIESFIAEANIC